HRRQRCFHLKGLLYLVSTDERILAIFQKTWALMLAHEFCEGRGVRFPVRRKALKIFKDGVDAGLLEKSDCVFSIFVKVRIENSLIHKVRVAANIEENPSQVMKPERGQNEWIAGYRGLYSLPVGADRVFAARLDLCDNCEAVVGRRLRKDRAISSLLKIEVPL